MRDVPLKLLHTWTTRKYVTYQKEGHDLGEPVVYIYIHETIYLPEDIFAIASE